MSAELSGAPPPVLESLERLGKVDRPLFLPQHGEHYRMEMFDGDNFTGQCVEVCEDCPFLQARGLTKDKISSIKVFGDGAYVPLTKLTPYTGFFFLSKKLFLHFPHTPLLVGC